MMFWELEAYMKTFDPHNMLLVKRKKQALCMYHLPLWQRHYPERQTTHTESPYRIDAS